MTHLALLVASSAMTASVIGWVTISNTANPAAEGTCLSRLFKEVMSEGKDSSFFQIKHLNIWML